MANTNPRRNMAPRKTPTGPNPWRKGDPSKKIGLNTPIPEPLMLQLDYLVANKVIYSKASFIREVVEKAATDEISRHYKLREMMKKLDAPKKKR